MAVTIGHVKRDLTQNERSLEERYPALNNPVGLRILLSDYHALINRQYAGDYDAVIVLTDLARAIEEANLTAKQRQALELVFVEDMTQEEAGRRMGGIAQDAVSHILDRATEAVAEIYFYWCGHCEGYTVGGGVNV